MSRRIRINILCDLFKMNFYGGFDIIWLIQARLTFSLRLPFIAAVCVISVNINVILDFSRVVILVHRKKNFTFSQCLIRRLTQVLKGICKVWFRCCNFLHAQLCTQLFRKKNMMDIAFATYIYSLQCV